MLRNNNVAEEDEWMDICLNAHKNQFSHEGKR